MTNIDDFKNNKEARDEVFRKSTKGFADMIKDLKEKEDEKNREEQIEETSHKLAGYMRELKDK